jgi:hypothetical protein
MNGIYRRDNQKPSVEGQTIQWPEEKVHKDTQSLFSQQTICIGIEKYILVSIYNV